MNSCPEFVFSIELFLYILHATGTQGKDNNALVSMNCFIYLNMLKEQRNYEIVLLLQNYTNFKNKSKFMLAYSHVKSEFIQSLVSLPVGNG